MNGDVSLSSNGHAYRVYLEGAQTVLSGLSAIDYYSAPLPSPIDETLAEIVSAYTGWPTHVRERFIASLPHDRLSLLAIFGHRAATLAIRNADVDQLRLGLIGNVIANYHIPDSRNVDTALAVFYHCARKLEIDPADLFDDVAQFTGEETANHLRTFGRRPDVTLKQFGWREIKTPEGVRYKFEW